jgi:hypothetical protein
MPNPGPSSTQIGAVAENLVANALIVASKGALAPFAPIADDEGIDLLAYHKPSGRVLPLQVKARTVTLKRSGKQERGNLVHFEIRKVVLARNRRTYLLAVLLDQGATHIESSWLLPLTELHRVGAERRDKYVIRASRSPTSRDRYHEFFCASTSDIVQRLTRLFERFDKRWPPSSV